MIYEKTKRVETSKHGTRARGATHIFDHWAPNHHNRGGDFIITQSTYIGEHAICQRLAAVNLGFFVGTCNIKPSGSLFLSPGSDTRKI
jgi:hypothetical protein